MHVVVETYQLIGLLVDGLYRLFRSDHQRTCDQPLGAVLKKELKDIPFLKQVIACTKIIVIIKITGIDIDCGSIRMD